MKSLKVVLVLLLVLGIYLATWPVPVEPRAWNAPKHPKAEGIYAENSKLATFEAMDIDGLHGPEAVITDAAGNLYATTHEGWIIRWLADSQGLATKPERWVNVGGRPLGIAFDSDQNLWVANAYIGLQKVDSKGVVTVATDIAEGVKIRYADDLVVTPDGKVYFSDASTKFSAEEIGGTLQASLLDILEHGGHGRIIEYDPQTDSTRVIMRDLNFANGVTDAQDGSFLLIAETGSYTVSKYWLKGPQAGSSELLLENLPGFPDNIHRGLDGRFWLGLTSPRSAILDKLSAKPKQRKIIQRLPSFMRPAVQPYGHVLAFNAEGEVLIDLQDPEGAYPATTGAWETDEHLYVSSLTASVLAKYKKADLGL